MAKLVLDMEREVIDKMEKYASEKHLSISDYVKDLFRKVDSNNSGYQLKPEDDTNGLFEHTGQTSPEDGQTEDDREFLEKLKKIPLSPEVEALSGVLKGLAPDDVDLKEIKWEYLQEKYGL